MVSPRRQIGLFGGSFNPPHLCHTMASLWALQTHPLDELWWVPTYKHAFGKALVPFEERIGLCELAASRIEGVKISDIERELGGESRTVDTVRALRGMHPDADFWLIIGTDILAETHKWKDWEGLMAMVRLIVVGRSGYEEVAAGRPEHQHTFVLPQVSSTAIRKALEDGLTAEEEALLRDWMDHRVLARIREQGWYRG